MGHALLRLALAAQFQEEKTGRFVQLINRFPGDILT